MASKTLEKLMDMQAKLDARIRQLKAKEGHQERKDETRRKILAGSYILEKYKREGSMDSFIKELDRFLKRKQDRILFGLEPKDEDTP